MTRMHLNVMTSGLSSGFQLLRGDIEDVIINTVDVDGAQPQRIDGQAAHTAEFRYELANLDFDGGLGYRDGSGSSKRVAALRTLIHRQRHTPFVLMLTINVRDTIGDEIEAYLRGLRARTSNPNEQAWLDWYIDRGEGERDFRLKAVVPLFILETAETAVMVVRCHPPIAYEGHERAHMIHFVFELEPRDGSLRAFGPQSPRDILRLPLLRAIEGRLECRLDQVPPLAKEDLARLLTFLPAPFDLVALAVPG